MPGRAKVSSMTAKAQPTLTSERARVAQQQQSPVSPQRSSKRKRKRSSRFLDFDENNDSSNSTKVNDNDSYNKNGTDSNIDRGDDREQPTGRKRLRTERKQNTKTKTDTSMSKPDASTFVAKKTRRSVVGAVNSNRGTSTGRLTRKNAAQTASATKKPKAKHDGIKKMEKSTSTPRKAVPKSESTSVRRALRKQNREGNENIGISPVALCYDVSKRRTMRHEIEGEQQSISELLQQPQPHFEEKKTENETMANDDDQLEPKQAPTQNQKQAKPSIESKIVAKESAIFEQRYKELLIFKESFGHCNVPYEYKSSTLARWCKKQREMYKRLKERSKRVDNNCSGDVDDNDENKKDARHQHRLRVIKKLDEIGFSWTKPKKVTPFFPQLADELKDFQLQHGHCNVPYVLYQDQYIDNQCQPHDPSNVNKRNEGDNEEKDGATKMQLGKFVHTMRRKYREGRINTDEKKVLDRLGFSWFEPQPSPQQIEKLRQYRHYDEQSSIEASSNRAVDKVIDKESNLANSKKNVIKIRITRESNTNIGKDDANVGSTNANKEAASHTMTPTESAQDTESPRRDDSPKRVATITPQSDDTRNSSQKQHDSSKPPTQPTKDFHIMMITLEQYKQDHEDDFLTVYSAKLYSKYDKELGNFVNKMRTKYRKGVLVPEEKQKLDEMGFLWEEIRKESNIIKSRYLKQKEFHEMIVSLKEYKQKNGDCNVPHKYPENPRLGVFVRRMRRKLARGDIEEYEKRLLDALGFSWICGQLTADFRTRMDELVQFKQEHGHCAVPLHYSTNQKLGNFVHNMRRKYARRIIHDDEQAELDNLGFIWKLHSGVRKTFVVDKKKLKKKEIEQSENDNSNMRNGEESETDDPSCKRDGASQNENRSSSNSSVDEESHHDHPRDKEGGDPQFADPGKNDEDSQKDDLSSRLDGLAGLMELARVAAASKMQEDDLVNSTTPLPRAERNEVVREGVAAGRPENAEA